MDRRKSLGHVLAENSISSTTGVLRRRSSVAFRSPDINLNVNDDEAERASLRLASVEQTPIRQTPINRRSLNIEAVVNMTSPQIFDGITECIKLNTQNKINTKNAFSLNMIDFMSWIAKNKQQEMGNLQMAAMGIDVSAKIYALRVDDLHHKTLNMAGNLEPEDNNQPESENTEEANTDVESLQDSRQSQKKKKKRNTNKELFTTIEALQGKKDSISLDPIMFGESDCQVSSMLYQFVLPQHCTQSLFLHPYNDTIIDEAVVGNYINSNNNILWPPIRPTSEKEINLFYTNFEFIDYSLNSEDSNSSSNPSESQSQSQSQPPNQPLSQDNNFVFDFDASLPPDNGIEDTGNFYEMHNDNDEHQVACHLEPAGPAILATLENIIDRIPTQPLEYSLLDHSLNIRWVGPSHWKIKNLAKNQESSKAIEVCTQKLRKKKKEFTFKYSTEKIKENNNKFKKGNSHLKMSTLKYSWLEEKLFLQKEPLCDKSTDFLFKLFMRPDVMIALANDPNTDTAVLNDESDRYDDNNLNDTYNDCPDNQIDDIPFRENSIYDNYESNEVPQDFVGTNLIEAPKLTQKIFIPYSQRAKKLNMHKLKRCIWKELITDEENNTDTNANAVTVQGEKSFVQIFENLPNKLNKHDAEELSFPIENQISCLLFIDNKSFLDVISIYNTIIITWRQAWNIDVLFSCID